MPRYRVIIHGSNFRLQMDGKWEKVGFYTPRFADASDPLLAEHIVLEEFRHCEKYRALMDANLNSADDPPILSGEDVAEIEPGAGYGKNSAGLTFYRESDRDRADPNAKSGNG